MTVLCPLVGSLLAIAQETSAPVEPAAEQAPAEEVQAVPIDPLGDAFRIGMVPIHGSLSLQYRLRSTSDDSDQDAYGLLGLDIGEAGRQPFTAHVLARTDWDIDGNIQHDGFYVFDSIDDTYGNRVTAQLLEAYVDYKPSGALSLVRLGRQAFYDTPVEAYVDGARIDSKAFGPWDFILGAYGGVPSHYYESSPHGDGIAGAFLEAGPWTGGRARADWMHVDDQTRFADHDNDLIGLTLNQQLGSATDLYANATWLEGDSRDYRLRGTWRDPDKDLLLQISWYELLNTQGSLALEFDPFYESAFDYFPYREASVRGSKAFGSHFDLAAGVNVRRLKDSDNDEVFNREFERYYLETTLSDLWMEGSALTLVGDLWDASDQKISTLGGDVSQTLCTNLVARAGTTYSLYKYDYYLNTEKDHVRTWLLQLDWKYDSSLRVRTDWQYETDGFDDYQTWRVSLVWTF